MSQYFPKPYEHFGADTNVKIDLSSYATNADLKKISHVDVSSFALKSNLANLKTEVDKLDIDKLAPVAFDLGKLSDVVKNDVVKKTKYNKLVTKVDNIDTTKFVLKTTYDTDNSKIEKTIKLVNDKITKQGGLATNNELVAVENKIPDANSLVKKTDLNAQITEIENKISSITGLATNSALTTVENKIPDLSSLVKITNYNTKINKIEKKIADHNHDKYLTTPEFNRLTTKNFKARLAQADLATKTDLDNKLQSLISKRVISNKIKHLLVENELKKLKTFDLSYFKGKGHLKNMVLKTI